MQKTRLPMKKLLATLLLAFALALAQGAAPATTTESGHWVVCEAAGSIAGRP